MKLHSDTLASDDIYAALRTAITHDEVASHIILDTFRPAGSRSRAKAWEIHLGTYTKDRDMDGKLRRIPSNSSNRDDLADYTATYSEWGWFIARLFELDSDLMFGPYKSFADFSRSTRLMFCI